MLIIFAKYLCNTIFLKDSVHREAAQPGPSALVAATLETYFLSSLFWFGSQYIYTLLHLKIIYQVCIIDSSKFNHCVGFMLLVKNF